MDDIRLKQIEHLKEEKKLFCYLAVMIKDRLGGDKDYLVCELVKVQEKANALDFATVATESELTETKKGLKTIRLDESDCVD